MVPPRHSFFVLLLFPSPLFFFCSIMNVFSMPPFLASTSLQDQLNVLQKAKTGALDSGVLHLVFHSTYELRSILCILSPSPSFFASIKFIQSVSQPAWQPRARLTKARLLNHYHHHDDHRRRNHHCSSFAYTASAHTEKLNGRLVSHASQTTDPSRLTINAYNFIRHRFAYRTVVHRLSWSDAFLTYCRLLC